VLTAETTETKAVLMDTCHAKPTMTSELHNEHEPPCVDTSACEA